MSPQNIVFSKGSPEEAKVLEALGRMREERDETAFAFLYDQYNARLYRVALLILKSEAEAEETLQDAFLQLWERSSAFDPRRGRLYTWLCLITRSKAIDRLRRRRRQEAKVTLSPEGDVEGLGNSVPPGESGSDALSKLLQGEERLWAQGLLAQLPAAQAQALSLAFYEGLSQSEIALRCGRPLGTIKTQMRLGLKKLATLARAEMTPWP